MSMKFFISCCGVTFSASAGRTSSSSSSSVSPSVPRRTTMSPPTPARTTMSSSRGLANNKRSPSRGLGSPTAARGPRATARRQTRSELGAAVPQRLPQRKSGRAVGSAASALPYSEWTPSLHTIAEDNVSSGRKSVVDRTAGIERAVVIKKSGREVSRVQSRSYTDDYGRASVTVVPAFTPTPFMF